MASRTLLIPSAPVSGQADLRLPRYTNPQTKLKQVKEKQEKGEFVYAEEI